jgi:hypothetical protein
MENAKNIVTSKEGSTRKIKRNSVVFEKPHKWSKKK